MKKTVRWVDLAQKFSRSMTHRQSIPREFLLICTGGTDHLVFLAAQLERFRHALGGPKVPLVVLARHDAGAAEFLFDDRAEVMTVDTDRLGQDSGYRANKLSEMFQSNFKGMVSLDYHRHPHLDEALITAAQRPAMAMKPAPLDGMDEALAENAALYQNQFESGPVGTPIPLRWEAFATHLSADDPDLPDASPYRLADDVMPEPAAFGTPTVLLQPFCPDVSRQSSVDVYTTLLSTIPDGHQVLLLGSTALLDRTPEYKVLLERPGVVLEEVDLARALPMMRSARLVIAAESAPMHLAALAGVPTLGIARDAGDGDTLPYPENNGPDNACILLGDSMSAEAAVSAVEGLLTQ